jgi:CubicO group peptidase (beta-lactamase class C family)
MKTALIIISIGMFVSCSENPTATDEVNNELEYVQPEQVGWSSSKLNDIKPIIQQSGYAAVMALYDGMVFFSWGNISRNYWCHSIRKPFLNALYGIHIELDNINLDNTIEELNIDDIPPGLTHDEKQAKIRDLLKSRSGIYHEAAAESQEMIDMRPERGSHTPNTYYYYNNWDFNALGTIFEQETGTKIFEEFKRKIADPIGMEDFDIDNCYYQYELEKSIHPAYCFRMSARDMARFGVLYQKNGIWNGTRIIAEEWITESTTSYSIYDSTFGISYGYMWNIMPEGSLIADLIGYSGYYHTGIGVHALIIIPDLKLVIVERYDTDGSWTDPGGIGIEIGKMIIEARLDNK